VVNMKDSERKKRIEELNVIIKGYHDLIQPYLNERNELILDCEHQAVPSGFMGGKCGICQTDTDWYCPDAPDHICDYEQDDGEYDEDSCRYCGQPEERK
jgi:hypothetical protein